MTNFKSKIQIMMKRQKRTLNGNKTFQKTLLIGKLYTSQYLISASLFTIVNEQNQNNICKYMTKLQTQNSNNDEKTKAHLKWELNFSENTFDWKAIYISRFDICKDNKLQNFNTILYIETLQQTHTCLNVNILQDLYFQCISNIMETAPCETGPSKPPLI